MSPTFTISNWHEIHEDVLKLVHSEAKERFEDISSESESITEKSITMIKAFVSLVAFGMGYILSKKLSFSEYWFVFFIIGLLSIIEFYLLFILIAPKEIRRRGIDPKFSLNKHIYHRDNEDFQIRAAYYNAIAIIKDNIDALNNKNETRLPLYKGALTLLVIIIFSIGALIGYTIYYHP